MGHDRSGLAGALQERAAGSRGNAENLHTPHRRLEAMRHQRREQPLSDAPPDRRLLRGQRDGPMWHERRGLVGAVQECVVCADVSGLGSPWHVSLSGAQTLYVY